MNDAAVISATDSYRRELWLSPDQAKAIPSSEYWNDAEVERGKEWDVADGNFVRMEQALDEKGLLRQLKSLQQLLDRPLAGRGISLASGTCWLEADLLRRNPAIESIACIELSRHRIFELASIVLRHYGVNASRVSLCWGSFYELKIPNNSLDFAILCQAFHHAYEPMRLLAEIRRVLKPSGQIVILGEHYFGMRKRARQVLSHFAKLVLNWRGYRAKAPFLPRYKDLFPVDSVKGDHHYTRAEYEDMFTEAKLDFRHRVDRSDGLQGFVLKRQDA